MKLRLAKKIWYHGWWCEFHWKSNKYKEYQQNRASKVFLKWIVNGVRKNDRKSNRA